ncbi:MAG: glycosyltransferase family 4 protein [Sphingosinicella sp.]
MTDKICRELIYLDNAYSVASVRARKHESFFHSRHRNGYFDRVWGVHPLTDLTEHRRAGRIRLVRFSPRQTILDGFIPGLPIPRWLTPLNVIWAQLRMLRAAVCLARRPRVVAIVATDTLYMGLFGYLVKRLSKKPLYAASYGNFDELYESTGALGYPRLLRSRRIELMIQRFVLKHADMIEAPSENARQYLIRHGAPPERIELLPVVKFVPQRHFVAPEERGDPSAFLRLRGIPTGRPYLLTVSRLLGLKHTDHAVKAMRIALEGAPKAIGLIAGEGPQRPQLEAMIAEFGLEGRLFLLGNVDHETLSTIIPGAVTLSPLTGMALIETSLGGSPPVAYDRDWQGELVRSGVNGFIVPYLDWQAMGEKALELLRDPELRQRLGRQMRRDALEYADRDRYYARERAAFDRLIGKAGGRVPAA